MCAITTKTGLISGSTRKPRMADHAWRPRGEPLLIVGWEACTTATIAQREIREVKGFRSSLTRSVPFFRPLRGTLAATRCLHNRNKLPLEARHSRQRCTFPCTHRVLASHTPADAGDELGPEAVRTKAEILNYLNSSFARLDKAIEAIGQKCSC